LLFHYRQGFGPARKLNFFPAMNEYIVNRYGEKWGTTNLEVEIVGTGGTYNLPDDSILRNKRVLGMFVLSNSDNSANSPSGRPLISDIAVRSTYITLKVNNDEVIHEHPLSDFLQNAAGDRTIRMLNLCNLNSQKSSVLVSNTALISDGESIVLQFIYEL